ncbi:MAG: KH domain-containing protein [Actinomycetia bacterium]|nr:KH domain-containing protein [Actinomycetes bacterium]
MPEETQPAGVLADQDTPIREDEQDTDTASDNGQAVEETDNAGQDLPADAGLITEGDAAADYLEALLDIIDLDGDIDIDVENDRASVAVVEVNDGELSLLVGDGGKTLDSLQDLVRLAAARETGHRSRLMLDVAGFRAARRQELQRIAVAAVAEAKAAQGPVRLDPMNAFERKVVHDAVAEAGLASESEGSDPERYVVVSPV